MKILKYVISTALVSILVFSNMAGAAKPDRRAKSNKAKADYIFMEALSYLAGDSVDAYVDMVGRAYELNSSDDYIASEYGRSLLFLNYPNDMDRVEEGIRLMRNYVERNPSDIMSGLRLGSVLNYFQRSDEALDVIRFVYNHNDDPRVSGGAYASVLAATMSPDSIRKAIDVVGRIESFEGLNPDLVGTKMRYYLMLGDTTSVLSEGRRLLAKSPNLPAYNVMYGDLNMNMGQPDSALYYFNRAISLDPSNGSARYHRSQYYQSVGDTAARNRDISEAMLLPDLDFETKLGLLHEYTTELISDSTQHDHIEGMFNDLVSQYPHEEQLRHLYGAFLYETGDVEGAAEQFDYLLSLDPDNISSWMRLIEIYAIMEKFDMANSRLKEALRFFPNNARLYLLGVRVALSEDKDLSVARKYAEQGMALSDDSVDVTELGEFCSVLGDIEYRDNNLEKSIEYYNKALEYDPENSLYLNNVAYYLASKNSDLEKARRYIDKALQLEKAEYGKNLANTLDTYAWVLFRQREYKEALNAINAALEGADAESAEVYDHAGDIYFMNGSPDEALEFWEKALELDPDNEMIRKKVKNKTFFF